jgi:uncharacterized membrane-anchored protein
MKSKFLTLNAKDLVKGLVVVVIQALITGIYQLFQSSGFAFDWVTFKPIVLTAVAAGLAYLIKNLFTNSQDQLFTKEVKK